MFTLNLGGSRMSGGTQRTDVGRARARQRQRRIGLLIVTAVVGSLLTALLSPGVPPAGAFTNAGDQSNQVKLDLQACRLVGGTTLPIDGKFVCPDEMYTSGNLGKSWNELDLVPHRLTTSAGTQPGATTDYKVSVAADGVTAGKLGYDFISQGVVNAAKSHPNCTVSSGPTSTSGSAAQPFGGGTDTVIYKDFTIHQPLGSTCVIDWYQRLALGSHNYPGSSLQSYIFPGVNLTGSKQTISIPVNQIAPQTVSKDMSASQSQDFAWNLTKTPNPASFAFTDTCSATGRTSSNIAITVAWTKVAASPTDITIITHVYANNPSARPITTTVTDRIYQGASQATEITPAQSSNSVTGLSNTVVVPANTANFKVIDFTGTVPASSGTTFNNVATGSYTDTITNEPIPQTTTATSSATVSTVLGGNNTATIQDTETISPGFRFAVTSTSGAAGSFANGYTVNTSTTGPVVWNSGTLTGDGSVTFNKTITADSAAVVPSSAGAALSDNAVLTGGGGFTASAPASVSLTSGATLDVGVRKTVPGGITGTQAFSFDVYAGSNADNSATGLTKIGAIPVSISPPATVGDGNLTTPATGAASSFTIVEQPSGKWSPQPNQVLTVTLPSCTGVATFNNTFVPATAKVQKTTVPAGGEAGWTFTLNGPGTPPGGEQVTTTQAGYVSFPTTLEQGSYTITEAPKPGWDFTSTSGQCAFTVVYPDDAAREYQCTFTNTARGALEVTKTVNWNGVTPDVNQSFQICITGPTYPAPTVANGGCKEIGSNGGTLTWNNLLQGNYTVTEVDPGTSWVVGGGNGSVAAVSPGAKTTAAGISNTRRLGSLQVTKSVNWNGVQPVPGQTFEICITGPSYASPTAANGGCRSTGDGTLTWNNLIPGSYTAAETDPGPTWTVSGSPTGVMTVPTDGGTATLVPVITNTRKLGALAITKAVDWNGVLPIEGQTFSICIAGPSYPSPNCRTFAYSNDLVQTWTGLIPGTYTITEPGLGSEWTRSGATSASVPADGGTGAATVTNTRKLGSLAVTKTVNWIGSTPTSQTFEICITGPSYPGRNCKPAGSAGGTLTWSDLIPGSYIVEETDPGSQWTVSVTGSPATVPTNGGQGTATVTNTLKPGGAAVLKTVTGAPPSGAHAFTFQLREGATPALNGMTLESQDANAANGGAITFTTQLVPGRTYQMCEIVMPAWRTSLGTFVPNSFNPPDGTAPNPNVDNSILCVNFTAVAGVTTRFTVDNTPPPGGRALTIGFWKNWASCANSNGKQKPVLDDTLAAAGPTGIVLAADTGEFPGFGPTISLVLRATDCSKAVAILNKSTFSGKKQASDPAFNLAAQLLAAELNYVAGAGRTPAATIAINQAVVLLGNYDFNGNGYTGKILPADVATMNSLAKALDDYNNNR